MAIETIGNSIPAPGYYTGNHTINDELLASTNGGFNQKGVTLKSGQGILLLGTLLIQDAATKKYVKYTGTGTPAGFLRQTTDTGSSATAPSFMGNLVEAGILNLTKVSAANSGITLSSITGFPVRVDTTRGRLFF